MSEHCHHKEKEEVEELREKFEHLVSKVDLYTSSVVVNSSVQQVCSQNHTFVVELQLDNSVFANLGYVPNGSIVTFVNKTHLATTVVVTIMVPIIETVETPEGQKTVVKYVPEEVETQQSYPVTIFTSPKPQIHHHHEVRNINDPISELPQPQQVYSYNSDYTSYLPPTNNIFLQSSSTYHAIGGALYEIA